MKTEEKFCDKYYFCIPDWLHESDMPVLDKYLWAHIHNRQKQYGFAFEIIGTMCKVLRVSDKTLMKVVRRMEKTGILSVSHGRGRKQVNRYVAHRPGCENVWEGKVELDRTWHSYQDYLKSETWAKIRRTAMKLAGWKCEKCLRDGGLNAHHRRYVTWGQESPDDLIVLCHNCHAEIHRQANDKTGDNLQIGQPIYADTAHK